MNKVIYSYYLFKNNYSVKNVKILINNCKMLNKLKSPTPYQLKEEINETLNGIGHNKVVNIKNNIKRLNLRDEIQETIMSINDDKYCQRMRECINECEKRVNEMENGLKQLQTLSAYEGVEHYSSLLNREDNKIDTLNNVDDINKSLNKHWNLLNQTNNRIKDLIQKNQEDFDVNHSVNLILRKRELAEIITELNPEQKLQYIMKEQDRLRSLTIQKFCHAVELKV